MPAAQPRWRTKPTCRLSVTPLVGDDRGGLAIATARGDTGIQFHALLARALNNSRINLDERSHASSSPSACRRSRVGHVVNPLAELLDDLRAERR